MNKTPKRVSPLVWFAASAFFLSVALLLVFIQQRTPSGSAGVVQDQAAHLLAIKSQNAVNELAGPVGTPEAMKEKQQLLAARATLDAQRQQWPNVTSGPDPWDNYRPCKEALEKASYVAELSYMKANSSLEDKVFDLEKGKLAHLRGQCDTLIRSGGKPA